jgi:hypothetical protein
MKIRKIVISESQIRRAIRQILLEQDLFGSDPLGDAPLQTRGPVEKGENLLGKKFSYEYKGEPQCVIVLGDKRLNESADISEGGPTYIAIVYSNATVTDPVAAGYGRLITPIDLANISVLNVYLPFVDKFSSAMSLVDYLTSYPDKVKPDDGLDLYKRFKLFVPDLEKLKKPKFESTEAAYQKSVAGECVMSTGDVIEQLVAIRIDPLAVKRQEMSDEEEWQFIKCLQSKTVESDVYAILQMGASLLGAGIMVEVLSDLIPGAFIIGYHIKRGNWAEAVKSTLQLLTVTVLPSYIQKKLKDQPVKMFFGTLVSINAVFYIIDELYELMGIESVRPPHAEIERLYNEQIAQVEDPVAFQNESKRAMLDSSLKKMLDPLGLKQKYPDI